MIDLAPGLQRNAVPARYRGVWQRTPLQTPTASDTSTTVFWLPWPEGQMVRCRLTKTAARQLWLDWNGALSLWQMREWCGPRGIGAAA